VLLAFSFRLPVLAGSSEILENVFKCLQFHEFLVCWKKIKSGWPDITPLIANMWWMLMCK